MLLVVVLVVSGALVVGAAWGIYGKLPTRVEGFLVALAAIVGNLALAGVGEGTLAVIRCFAAGAVVASLATEVFPQAFREDRHWAGIATALGVILAFSLSSLAGG